MNTHKPLQKKGILSKTIGDETMLYDPDSGSVCVLNDTAAFVWNLCNGRHSPDHISALLRDTYEAAEGTNLETDTTEILESFLELGLLA